jgi:hypothetical protein
VKLSDSKILRPKPLLLSVSFLILIFSLISISIVFGMYSLQSKGNYAIAQTMILGTTELKVNFDKLVEAGTDQTIRLTVKDIRSGDPISDAVVKMNIYFPGGAPIRQFTLLTNEDGKASLTLPIDRDAPPGQYGLDVLAGALGYFDSAVGTINFAVNSDVEQNVSLDDYTRTSHTISGHG